MWRSVYLAPCVWLPTQVQSDFAVCQSVRPIPITPSPIRVWMSRRLWKFVTFLSRSALKSFMRVDTWLNECVKCMWVDACKSGKRQFLRSASKAVRASCCLKVLKKLLPDIWLSRPVDSGYPLWPTSAFTNVTSLPEQWSYTTWYYYTSSSEINF